MRINGKPELDYLVYWEPKERDSIGPKRAFIVGFNESQVLSEVIDCETWEVIYRAATNISTTLYGELQDAHNHRAFRDIKNRVLGMPRHRQTEEVYIFGEPRS